MDRYRPRICRNIGVSDAKEVRLRERIERARGVLQLP